MATGRGESRLFCGETTKGREGIEMLKLSGHELVTSTQRSFKLEWS